MSDEQYFRDEPTDSSAESVADAPESAVQTDWVSVWPQRKKDGASVEPARQPAEPEVMAGDVTAEKVRKRENLKLSLAIAASLLVLAIVAVAVLGSGSAADRIGRWLRYGGNGEDVGHHFTVYTVNDYAQLGDLLAVADVSGLTLYEDDGTEAVLAQSQMDTPSLKTGDQTVLAYDVAGTNLTVVHRTKGVLLSLSAEGELLDADLSSGGTVCYAAAEDGYKTVLTVRNASMQEIYKWYSSTQFFNQCAISEQGTFLAAIAVGQTDNAFCSTAYLFSTESEEPLATLELGGELILELDFVDDKTLCAVGEHSLQFFTRDGELVGQFTYPAGTLTQFDLAGDGFQALALNKNKAGNACTLVSVDDDGDALASLDLEESVIDLSACEGYLAVLTSRDVRIYDEKLRLCGQSDDTGMASRVCARGDGTALLIGGSETQLFIP